MGQQEEQRRFKALVGRVDQHSALTQQVRVLLQDHVGHREHQRMAGVHEHRSGKAGLVERLNGVALEADALVALQDRLVLAAIAPGDSAVTLADRRRDVGDLEAPGLARMRCAAERVKRLQEECPHEDTAGGGGLRPSPSPP